MPLFFDARQRIEDTMQITDFLVYIYIIIVGFLIRQISTFKCAIRSCKYAICQQTIKKTLLIQVNSLQFLQLFHNITFHNTALIITIYKS